MQYVDAFRKLGYALESQRQDWSAEKSDGVCITIWNKEVNWTASPPYLDCWELPVEEKGWTAKSGHRKRTGHVDRAMQEFEGFVDVIVVSGTPGESYADATPWVASERRNHVWRVTRFDPDSGLFRVEAVAQRPETSP